jgi:hypothetical protein
LIVEGNSAIVYVSHDEDGSWQFHGPEIDMNDEDMRLVALGEMLEIDPSIVELANLPMGFEAIRKDGKSKWEKISGN